MITTGDGQSVLLLGCREGRDKIYKLSWNGDELEWSIMNQQLEFPRTDRPILMWVPEEDTNCS